MKKLIFISNISRGISNFSIPSIEAGRALGYEIHIAANLSEFKENQEAYPDVLLHHIDIKRSPFHVKNIIAYKKMKSLFKQEGFDVIHCNTPMGGVLGRICGKKGKVDKVIYTAHGFHFYKKGHPLLNIVYKRAEKIMARWTDAIITINSEDFKSAKQFHLKKEGAVYFVPGVGVTTKEYAFEFTEEEEYRKSLGVGKEDFVLISTGDLISRKNYETAIKSIGRLKNDNIHLLLCGTGPKLDKLQRLVKKYGLERQVHFLGYRTDVKELLKVSDVFFFPSKQEGLPRALMEAMASGLPCIASRIRGNIDLIEEGKGGFLREPKDVEGMSECIHVLYKEKQLRETMGEYNRNQIKNFDVEIVKEEIYRIYQEVLTKKRKIRVLHLLQSNQFSGAENVVCQIIDLFKEEHGIEMAYCSQEGRIREAVLSRGISFLPMEGLCRKEVRRVVKEYHPSMIHAHDVRASVLAAMVSRKIPVISHMHVNNQKMSKFHLKTVIYAMVSRRFKHIFWVSNSALQKFYFRRFLKKKSSVLYNVINEKEIYERLQKDTNTYDYDVLYLGRLTYQKNPSRLLEILAQLLKKAPELRIGIVGEGELLEATKQLAEDYGIQESVDFLGFQENPLKLLQDAKVMILTSRYEGTPMCVLEAMALGVPIVSTPVDGVADLVSHGENGYLSQENEELVEYLVNVVRDKELRQKLSKVAKERFHQYNNRNDYKDKIQRAYDR